MSNGEYKELLEFLQDEFGKVEKRFDGIDKRFDRVEQRLDVLEFEIKAVRRELRDAISEVNARIDELYKSTDGYIVTIKKVDTELVAMQAKYQRLDERIMRLEKLMTPH